MWDWAYAAEILPALLRGLRITVQATLLGTALALVVGLVLAVLRRSRIRVVSMIAGGIIEFIRSTPLVVQLVFVYFGLAAYGIRFSGLVTGVLVLGLHYGCYMSEVYRAGIEGVPRGQWEASKALNFTAADTWRRVILPQAIPPIVPALTNYLIAMYKDTPTLLFIGVSEVLLTARRIGSQTFDFLVPITLVGVLFFIVSYPSVLLLRRLERRLARSY
jgi:polar amino acid transport system permease protein